MERQSCDNKHGLKDIFVNWLEKVPAKLLYNKDEPKEPLKPAMCADQETTCDPLKTCCKQSNGKYGCCPHSDGVCCELDYCCPANTECGKKVGECIPKSFDWKSIEFKAPKLEDVNKIEDGCGDIACSSQNSTCCKKADGTFSCCPYTDGTCCGSHGFWYNFFLNI